MCFNFGSDKSASSGDFTVVFPEDLLLFKQRDNKDSFCDCSKLRETTTTTGTGINLLGAVTNFETFTANLSNSDTTYYAIVDSTNDFEVGLGTFHLLARH